MNAQAPTADDVLADARPAGPAAPSPSASPRKGAARPVPTVSSAFAHLSLDALRQYRRSLGEEEGRVSYWRRILQARLDVVEAGTGARVVDTATLRPLLSSERVGAGRRALVEVLELDDIPPLPSLGELWDRQVSPHDEVATEAFRADLRLAEAQLSAYRSALHRRIGEATGELIARYREQPDLCLSALPLTRRRTAPGA
jgi:hypothetical protein